MKLMIVEVREEVIHRAGVAAGTGKAYDFHLQTAYLHTQDEYPVRVDLRLETGVVHKPGKYLVGADAVRFDRKMSRFALDVSAGLMPLGDALRTLQELTRSEGRPVSAAA